ncbi:MAG TPA: MFS transporter [Candidatus Mailhella merdigallinarum]|uniref:MFS transporter n=1 Tax=Candidatus Mailhella merdigallinarum TaxID=2838658 RepID=A0A9D2KJT5_9BACT|nr:MFS transporter [Desulfovibrionaceae bacterium]HJA08204.1 MFS transporter [Candidatus Mailhella merdigallinarum]
MGKAFYGWYMVMFNLLVLASGTGLVNNSAGQFLKPLTEALGIARSEASLYNSCLTVVMILLVPQLTKLFKAARPRVWSTLGVFCVAGGWFCLSFAQNKWHLYLCAAVIGVGLSFTGTTMVAMITGKWFVKNKGKALGIAMLGTAMGAMIYNPVCAALIQSFGFRAAYRITAGILLCGMAPYLLGYAFKPEDKGQVALGLAERAPDGECIGVGTCEMSGLTWDEAKKTGSFLAVCFIAMALNACGIGIYTQMQAYLTDVGYAVVLAASVVSIASLCNGFAKMLFGWLDDKIGTRGNFCVATGVLFCGMLTLLFVREGIVMCYIAAVLFGVGLSCPTIITPMVTMAALGQKDFSAIYSRVASFFYLGATLGPIVSGLVFDLTGGYRAAILFYMALLAVCVLIGTRLLHHKAYETNAESAAPVSARAEQRA